MTEEIAELNRKLNVLQIENENLRTKNIQLETKLKQQESEETKKIYQILTGTFTPGQIKRILNPEIKRIRWSTEDIASAISLSPKAYRYLRKNKYPLPALSTLRKWALSSLDLSPGILTDVFRLMKDKSHLLNELQRLTVLAFDEIYIYI